MGREGLLGIGEVSRYTGISVPMLRYYDKIGLCKPARVDPQSGYRLYRVTQVWDLGTISFLHSAGFSYEEVARIVESIDGRDVDGLLKTVEDELRRRMEACWRGLGYLGWIRDLGRDSFDPVPRWEHREARAVFESSVRNVPLSQYGPDLMAFLAPLPQPQPYVMGYLLTREVLEAGRFAPSGAYLDLYGAQPQVGEGSGVTALELPAGEWLCCDVELNGPMDSFTGSFEALLERCEGELGSAPVLIVADEKVFPFAVRDELLVSVAVTPLRGE